MNRKTLHRTMAAALFVAAGVLQAAAQQYYDITSYYLQNANFTETINYGLTATDNVSGVVKDIPGWTKDSGSASSLVVGATFAYGTQATYYRNTISIPATGPDGQGGGAGLTLCAAMKQFLAFYQEVMMPAGKYRMEVTYYNCNPDAQAGTSLSGWVESNTASTLSTTAEFPSQQWLTETVDFELSDITSGRIQLGFRAGSGLPTSSAMLIVDRVRLLRDTPYGAADDAIPGPEVVGDTRFARGATMAFGRIRSTDSDVTEKGFCWAEYPEPTVADNKTTEQMSNGVYIMRDLKPATIYYMRPYAKNKGGKVGYGETIKFSTVKKGNVTYWYNNGGDEAANNRVNAAAQQACDIFSNLTEMVKHFNIGYSAGTPTADCYYADEPWMNMGANSSYQRTGTIMHEMQHGLGVIPYTTQWSKNILRERLDGDGRGTGHWLGERVSAFLDFWDNTTGSQLNGDYQHMWPYGINGASEDNGSLVLYYGNAMVGQALGEDGLEHRSNTFAEPCYIFTQEDNTKYYLKNESPDRGLYTSYLVAADNGTLSWKAMTADEARADDHTAWYISFTPSNQYYQLRNAATGQYMTYSGGFKTMNRTSVTNADNFHLMKGRVDVGADHKRGYWLVHPTGNLTPNCLQANANGALGSATFNLANTATTQRWLILTADEMDAVEQASIAALKQQTAEALAGIKALANVPHTEVVPGTDEAFAAAISTIEQIIGDESATTGDLLPLLDQAREAAFQFLCHAVPTDKSNPFDVSYLVQNAAIDSNDGWSAAATINYSCAEFYQTTFDFNQTVVGLPAGDYQLTVQGFQRPGSSADAYNDYAGGSNKVTAYLYAGNKSVRLAHIATEARSSKLGGNESSVGNGLYMPNDMQSASLYFAKGLYGNIVDNSLDEDGTSLKIGLRSSSMGSSFWCIFDNFRLLFMGNPNAATGISTVETSKPLQSASVYTLDGRLVRFGTHSVEGLQPGIYVVGGKKVVLK